MDEIQYIGNTYFLENDVSIDCNGYDTPVEPHTHNFIEFVYILKGKCLHTVNGTAYPLDSGDLLIVNYNEVHGFTGDSDLRFYNILIKPSIIDQSLAECRDLFSLFETAPFREFKHLIHDGCRFIRFSPEEKNCFEYMLQLLEKELRNREAGFDLTTRAGVNFLLTMIFRKMRKTLIEAKHAFQPVLEYISTNYAENLSAAELAELCHYNPSYFSRIFKKYTGTTFSEYLKRTRIAASYQLIDTGCKLADLYLRVGYTNKTNFYKHFRQLTGMTPLAYRKVKK